MLINTSSKRGVLLVAVVPPPVHGQSVLGKALMEHDFPDFPVGRVAIRSSVELQEVGVPSLKKLVGLIRIIFQIWKLQLKKRYAVLYYTAGSGSWVPFVRDFMILGLCRPLFKKLVVHYHSGDVPDFYQKSKLKYILAKFTYGKGAWSIRLGEGCPVPDETIGASKVFTVANGIELPNVLPLKGKSDCFRILFLGNLYEEKGVLDLIKAVKIAADSQSEILLSLVGEYPNCQTQKRIEKVLGQLPNNVAVDTPSPKYGDEKWQEIIDSDVLVLPSYYELENSPLVLMEAMACGRPVIATRWRGISSIVDEGVTGYLVEPRDVNGLATKLKNLIEDSTIWESMARASEKKYRDSYTLNAHLAAMSSLLYLSQAEK